MAQFNRYKDTVCLYCGAKSINNKLSTNLHANRQKCYKDTCDLTFPELISSNPSKHKKCCHPWWNPRFNFLKKVYALNEEDG